MKLRRTRYPLCYHHILIFIISHIWSGTDGEWLPGYSINVPSRVTVQRGLCVYIPCRFTVPEWETLTIKARGLWYHIGSREFVVDKSNTEHWNNGRFFLTGDIWRGDCSLYIEDPLYADKGRYRFRIEDTIRFNYLDIQPYVEVTALKDKPEISPMKSWLDGEEVTLSCTFLGTCTQITPKVTWGGNIQNRKVLNWVKNHENGTKSHYSTLTFTARKEHNNSTLSCIVQLNGGLTTAQQITIKVEYPPRAPEIKCSINKEPNRLSSSTCTMDANNTVYPLEGSQLFLTCSADSVPESSLVWKYSNQSQISSSMNKLTFLNVSLTDEGFYTCQATNAHGTGDTSVTIKIVYKPRIVNGGITSCWKVENGLGCTCLIQSFPTPNVEWKINGEPINKANMKVNILTGTSHSVVNSTLTLPIEIEIRNISCVASNIHGELVQELFIKMAHPMSKAFPLAAVLVGCFAVVMIVIGVLLILFYRKRKMAQNEENSRQTNVNDTDPIYGNSEVFSTGLHGIGQIPQTDHQPPAEAGSENENFQDLQYMSVNFSKLKSNVPTNAEEVEYSAIKYIN